MNGPNGIVHIVQGCFATPISACWGREDLDEMRGRCGSAWRWCWRRRHQTRTGDPKRLIKFL